MLVHGTCVTLKGNAVLLRGVSGVGKSSLALHLIDRGACLLADDQVDLCVMGGKIIASVPPSLKGLLEVRGLGICSFSFIEKAPLALCVDLCDLASLERLPTPSFVAYDDVEVPHLKLGIGDPLNAIKLELHMEGVCSRIL